VPAENLNPGDGRLGCNIRMPMVEFFDQAPARAGTGRIIWQNLAGTIAVVMAGIHLAAVGLLNPALAAFIHVASEMTFILNSARLLPSSVRAVASAEIGLEPALKRAGNTAQQRSEVCAFR
jgi:hypothetical protein